MDAEIALADGSDLAAHPMPAGKPSRAHRADVIHYPAGGGPSTVVGLLGYEPTQGAWTIRHLPGLPAPAAPVRDDAGAPATFADPEEALAALATTVGIGDGPAA